MYRTSTQGVASGKQGVVVVGLKLRTMGIKTRKIKNPYIRALQQYTAGVS